MAASSQNSDDCITGINITPMVDVMLVLLVIFMIAAPTLYSGNMKVELPAAKSGEKTEKVTLKFSVLPNGKLLLDKKEIQANEVTNLVKKALELDPKADALVEADRGLTHGAVIEFIDHLKVAGLTKVGIGVESPAQQHTN